MGDEGNEGMADDMTDDMPADLVTGFPTADTGPRGFVHENGFWLSFCGPVAERYW